MGSLQSHLLVAVPHLPDSNFYRSVVLLIHHDEEGAYGVILNRPSEIRLKDVWEQIANRPCHSSCPIYVGGPVEGPLIALHTDERLAESTVLPGLHVSTQRDSLNAIVEKDDSPFRLFSGYAGWGQGQLESELAAGGWLSMPASLDLVFANVDDLWRRVADEIGRRVLGTGNSRGDFPSDPSLN